MKFWIVFFLVLADFGRFVAPLIMVGGLIAVYGKLQSLDDRAAQIELNTTIIRNQQH